MSGGEREKVYFCTRPCKQTKSDIWWKWKMFYYEPVCYEANEENNNNCIEVKSVDVEVNKKYKRKKKRKHKQ